MARARNIKPSFFKNEDLSEMNTYARLLFIGLWCLADREGILEDRPKRIKGELFPYEEVDVENLLQQLHDKEFIVRYSVDGQAYIYIPKFVLHQNPHHREAPSKYPKPYNGGTSSNHVEGRMDQPDASPGLASESTCLGREEPKESPADSLIPDSLNLIPDSLPPITETEEAPKDVVVVGEKKIHVFKSVIDLYRHYFALDPNNTIVERLHSYLDDGMQMDAIAWAMHDSAEKGKPWYYAKGTIERLFQSGVRTAEQAESADQEFKRQKSQTSSKVVPLRADRLPETVQRQLEQEKQGLPRASGEKKTVMDYPELRKLLEDMRRTQKAR